MILSSKQQFIPKYIDGTKLHSIRQGKRWRTGMTIHFYQNARQKNMSKFMPDKEVVSVERISMTYDGYQFEVSIGSKYLMPSEIVSLAHNDGFDSMAAMQLFFFPPGTTHDEFSGQIIHWTKLRYS